MPTIRQKGEFQNGCYKKTKQAKFSEKRMFLTPWYAHVHVRIRGKEIFVFRKIWPPLFLVTPFLRFTLLSYDVIESKEKHTEFWVTTYVTMSEYLQDSSNHSETFHFYTSFPGDIEVNIDLRWVIKWYSLYDIPFVS